MASRGTPAFDVENPTADNSHRRLLEVATVITDDVQLAAHFRVSVPTVRKWRRLPLGYRPAKAGRKSKRNAAPTTTPPPEKAAPHIQKESQ